MAEEYFEAGTIIFREGDPPDFVGFIVEGEAEILKKQDDGLVLVGKAAPGDFVGETAALEGKPYGVTVRAAGRMLVEVLPSSELSRLILARALIDRRQARLESGQHGSAHEPDAEIDSPGEGRAVSLKSGSADLEWPLAHAPDPLPLPFTVGRRPAWQEPAVDREVSLQLHDDMPFRLSRVHFTIFEENREIFVRDERSQIGTRVNGALIGGRSLRTTGRLDPGDNIVIVGGADSRFVFHVHVTP